MVGKVFNAVQSVVPGRGSDDLCGFCYGMSMRRAALKRMAGFCESVYERTPLSDVVSAAVSIVQSTRDERALQRFEREFALKTSKGNDFAAKGDSAKAIN